MAGTQLIDDDENSTEEEKPKPHRGDVRKREGGRRSGRDLEMLNHLLTYQKKSSD